MIATEALIETRDLPLHCGACRYFTHDRCCHAVARLERRDTKAGDCPHFRFAQSHSVRPDALLFG